MMLRLGTVSYVGIWAGVCAICTVNISAFAQMSAPDQARALNVLQLTPEVFANIGVSPEEASVILARLASAEAEVEELFSAIGEVDATLDAIVVFRESTNVGLLQTSEQQDTLAALNSSAEQAQDRFDTAIHTIRAVMFVDWPAQELQVLDSTIACGRIGLPLCYGPVQLDARGQTTLRRALRAEALSQTHGRHLQPETEQFLNDLRQNSLVINAETTAAMNTTQIKQLWPPTETE